MSADRDERVDEAIAEYLAACDAGRPPDRAAFLAKYPDLGDSLREFLDDHTRMRAAAGRDPNLTVELGSDADGVAIDPGSGSLGTVRYIGDYELLAEIARGGMGVVFRARQVSLNREVALKMILTGQLASDADVARFRAEAEAAAALDHPNILPIYEVGEHQGQQYFAMKFVPGGSLAGKIAELVADPRAAVAVFGAVCRAVDFAHRRGILHRDLKPSNVLLDVDGTPYVTDFGLAKKVGGDSGLTQSGAIVGTPSYMAPEQARAEKQLTTAADVYALGAILYELLTGRPPLRGASVMDTILQVLNNEPDHPHKLNPKADRDLSVIALKCLEKNPTKRYESASTLADDLDRWARGEPVSVSPATRIERAIKWARRKPTAAAAYGFSALTMALGLVVFVVFGFWREAEGAKREAELARDEAERLRGITDTALFGEAAARQDVERQRDKLARIGYARNVRFAKSYLHRSDPWRALAFLDSTPPNLRGWEYGYLHGSCRERKAEMTGSRLELQTESKIAPGEGSSVAFSHDGSKIVCARGRGPVRILDAATWATLAELEVSTAPVMWAAFNPDGSKIVTASRNGTAHIWDVATRKPLLEFRMSQHQLLRGPSFSPDGSKILGNGPQAGTSGVWDSTTGKLLLELVGEDGAYSPDGSRIVTADSAISIWDAATGVLLRELDEPDQMNYAPAFSSDGARVVVCGENELPRIWDSATGKVLQRLNYLQPTRNPPWIAEFSPDGQRILTTGPVSGPLQLWDTESGDELLALPGSATCARFSPDGTRIITLEWVPYQNESWVVIYSSQPTDRAILPRAVAPAPHPNE